MPHLPDFEAWAIFAKVAERGSFSAAANELGLSKATISKAVTRLELRLATPLFHRSSRRLSLTESGRAAQERAARILSDGEAIEEAISERHAAPRGRVRLAVPMSFAIAHVTPLLPLFHALHPQVSLDLHLSDAHTDLIGQGIDVALRIGVLEDSALKARRLFTIGRPLVGAPAFFDRHGRPDHPRDLERYPAITYSHLATPDLWHFQHPEQGDHAVRVSGPIRTNNGDVLMPALLSGMAIAIMPEFLVWKALRDGALEEALPDWAPPPAGLHIVTPPGALRPARVKAVIDFLSEQFLKAPWDRANP